MNESGTVQRVSQVTESVSDLRKVTDVLGEAIARIGDRLADVTIQEIQSPEVSQKSPEQIKVPLAQDLTVICRKLQSYTVQLESLYSRIEV
jgi:hypothetical protein